MESLDIEPIPDADRLYKIINSLIALENIHDTCTFHHKYSDHNGTYKLEVIVYLSNNKEPYPYTLYKGLEVELKVSGPDCTWLGHIRPDLYIVLNTKNPNGIFDYNAQSASIRSFLFRDITYILEKICSMVSWKEIQFTDVTDSTRLLLD